jgi:hypothetical protein
MAPSASMAMHCAAGANDTPKEVGSFMSATHGLEHALQGPLTLQSREGQRAATQDAVDGGWGDPAHQSLGTMNLVVSGPGPLVSPVVTHQTSRVVSPTLLYPQGALQLVHADVCFHIGKRHSAG